MSLLRLLLWLFAVLGIGWLLRRAAGGRTAASSRPERQQTPETTRGLLVRDRICNTFLPKARALTERVGDDEHYFCSERCRSIFLGQR